MQQTLSNGVTGRQLPSGLEVLDRNAVLIRSHRQQATFSSERSPSKRRQFRLIHTVQHGRGRVESLRFAGCIAAIAAMARFAGAGVVGEPAADRQRDRAE